MLASQELTFSTHNTNKVRAYHDDKTETKQRQHGLWIAELCRSQDCVALLTTLRSRSTDHGEAIFMGTSFQNLVYVSQIMARLVLHPLCIHEHVSMYVCMLVIHVLMLYINRRATCNSSHSRDAI